ncbi:uncharacterized protein RJT21DRAFT_17270 [Scheffersomyces amazonensis]|uniref:uncharacterized protein n=1 Tax=Scheffersomyces amazonensis TaxID=1078765 RepID=UPI00315D0F89
MKFGNNLQHLSIPEWRCYNIDYNDLKYQIRTITQSKSKDLKPLQQSFIENFDYINLFVQTKYGELTRKFNYFELYFDQLVNAAIDINDKSKQRSILIEIDEIFYQIIEISQILKNLSKFILIQKIAAKKIFKKFLKYYKDDGENSEEGNTSQTALKFIINLKNYLLLNKNSFINFDSSDLTLKLTNIIQSIKLEQKRYFNLINNVSIPTLTSSNVPRKNSFYSNTSISEHSQYQNSILPRNNSVYTLAGSTTLSSSGGTSPPPTSSSATHHPSHPHYHIQQDPPTNESNFDLGVCVKKNFKLNALLPDDSNTLSEILLNLNIYLNFKHYDNNSPILPTSQLSFIFLNNIKSVEEEPSYIISQKDEAFSIIVGYVGGLRKYSYCILPNDIVQLFIDHLNDRSNEDVKLRLYDYFKSNKVSPLTRKTFDAILANDLKPNLRLILQRRRYILKQTEEEEDADEDNQLNIERPIIDEQDEQQVDEPQPEQQKVKHKYQDDYLITLDNDIYTTNNPKYISKINLLDDEHLNEIDIENNWDKFPHNHLCLFSNDSNLSNFENSLISVVDTKDGLLTNTYSTPLLRKLPPKLQSLISNNNSLNLFKNLEFYQYMNSCYNNVIPQGPYINNHYNYLLNLNLLKNFESIENFNNQMNSENSLIKAKSNKILRHQLSLKSLAKFNPDSYKIAPHAPDFYLKANQSHFQQINSSPQNIRGSIQQSDSFGSNSSSKSIFTKNKDDKQGREDVEIDEEDDGVLNMNVSHQDILHFRRNSDDPEEVRQEQLIDNLDENEYSIYLKLQNDQQEVNPFMIGFLNFRKKFFSHLKSFMLMEPYKRPSSILPQYKSPRDQMKKYYNSDYDSNYETSRLIRPVSSSEIDYAHHYSSSGGVHNYDSINEEPPSFLSRNKFMNIQYQYELDYDQTLSYIYFSLNLMSIFLSGIELGIIYSIFIINHTEPSQGTSPPQFLFVNNLWLVLILILGLLLSLMFSMISINLIFQRYHQAPLYHTFIAWIGFSIVCVCCIWSSILLLQGF